MCHNDEVRGLLKAGVSVPIFYLLQSLLRGIPICPSLFTNSDVRRALPLCVYIVGNGVSHSRQHIRQHVFLFHAPLLILCKHNKRTIMSHKANKKDNIRNRSTDTAIYINTKCTGPEFVWR